MELLAEFVTMPLYQEDIEILVADDAENGSAYGITCSQSSPAHSHPMYTHAVGTGKC